MDVDSKFFNHNISILLGLCLGSILYVFTAEAQESKISVPFVTEPAEARLIQGEQEYNTTPIRLKFIAPAHGRHSGMAGIAGGNILWPIGTITTFPDFQVQLSQGPNFTYNLQQLAAQQSNQGRAQTYMDLCNRALQGIADSCYPPIEGPGTRNLLCGTVSNNARRSCYVDELKESQCAIATAHERLACSHGNDDYGCNKAQSVLLHCAMEDRKKQRQLQRQLREGIR